MYLGSQIQENEEKTELDQGEHILDLKIFEFLSVL